MNPHNPHTLPAPHGATSFGAAPLGPGVPLAGLDAFGDELLTTTVQTAAAAFRDYQRRWDAYVAACPGGPEWRRWTALEATLAPDQLEAEGSPLADHLAALPGLYAAAWRAWGKTRAALPPLRALVDDTAGGQDLRQRIRAAYDAAGVAQCEHYIRAAIDHDLAAFTAGDEAGQRTAALEQLVSWAALPKNGDGRPSLLAAKATNTRRDVTYARGLASTALLPGGVPVDKPKLPPVSLRTYPHLAPLADVAAALGFTPPEPATIPLYDRTGSGGSVRDERGQVFVA